ncbi:MAG: LOG family protein [Planctomycetota bacterium]
MRNPAPRRYQVGHAEIDKAIEELVAKLQEAYGAVDGADFAREILVSGARLVRDRTGRADLKLINAALKELRHALAVFAPFEQVRKVSIFGSARTQRDEPAWKQAYDFSERLTRAGWMVITGAGDGIMGAAQGGAGREKSFGVNIRLPFEQVANKVIAGDHKLINFRYFFTRKLLFVKESHAIALFPGGFGTHDEGFEALTLVQTGKSGMVPIVFIDEPGGKYWRAWEEYVHEHLRKPGLISPEDVDLYRITDSVDQAVAEVLGFYANYHSSRYVDDLLVLRVRSAPGPRELEELNRRFGEIVTSGRIEVGGALAEERGEAAELPRVTLRFNRRDMGKLRRLIDALNALTPVRYLVPPGTARTRD